MVISLAAMLAVMQAFAGDLDSLEFWLRAKSDTLKVHKLVRISTQLRKSGELKRSFDVALEALKTAEMIGWKRGLGLGYGAVGTADFQMGNYSSSLEWQLKALAVREELGDLQGKSAAYTNIGLAYHGMMKYREALRYLDSSYAIKNQIQDKKGLVAVHNNRGMVLADMGMYEPALEEYGKSLVLGKELKDDFGMAYALNNLGSVYSMLGWNKEALLSYKASLEIKRKLGEKNMIAACYGNIATVYLLERRIELAQTFADSALKVSTAAGNKEIVFQQYRLLARIDSARGDFRLAMRHMHLYAIARDSVLNEQNTRRLIEAQLQYDFDKKATMERQEREKSDFLAELDKEKQQKILIITSAGLLVTLVLVVLIFRSIRASQRKSRVIEVQKRELEEKQKEILESIRYARRIQVSLLPSENRIRNTLLRLLS
ncbi:MAG: tetratricopeptide repeat protein [Bacteroidia bacterium]|nr:tetratricopeptide repeat protein [Bacteroidia bacterium]